MTTKIVSIKTWRQDLTKLWRDAKGKQVRFIVMNHSKPMFEVKPIYDEALVFEDWTPEDRYQAMESSLKFWEDDEDAANLFDTTISL